MSKAMDLFSVIREQQNRELSRAYHRACLRIAGECKRCPLDGTERCAIKMLPQDALNRDRVGICADWISLYFRDGKV